MTTVRTAPAGLPGQGRHSRHENLIVSTHTLLATLTLVLWLLSLNRVDLDAISGIGLLSAVPPIWWIATVSVVPYLLAALDGGCPAWILSLYQLGLVMLLFGTTSATYPVPRFPWTYKHLGVVEHILATGGIDRAIDIYNNWPGFFLGAAALVHLTGISPMGLAQWAEPVFSLLFSAALVYAIRGLTRDRRIIWVTLLVFTLGNWIGQNYFSPQALAFTLALVFMGLVLRALPARDAEGRVVPRRLVARFVRYRNTERLPPPPPPLGGLTPHTWNLAAATVVYAGIVVTHQLTPVALLFQLGALVALVRVRHLWVVVLWAAIEAGWVGLAFSYVSRHWSLFSPGAQTPSAQMPQLTPSLPGMTVTHHAPTALVGVVALAATTAFVVAYLRRTVPLVPAALAGAPVLLLAVQSYGGEGVFRVYLYALPWLSFVIAMLLVVISSYGLWGRLLVGLAVTGVGVCTLLSMLGSELVDYVSPRDVMASQWFEDNAPAGSYAVQFTTGGFPLMLTANYPGFLHDGAAVTLDPDSAAGPPSTDVLLGNAQEIFDAYGPKGYVVMTEQQYTYARMYGLASEAQLDEFVAAVATSGQYRIVYHRDHDVIAQYVGRG